MNTPLIQRYVSSLLIGLLTGAPSVYAKQLEYVESDRALSDYDPLTTQKAMRSLDAMQKSSQKELTTAIHAAPVHNSRSSLTPSKRSTAKNVAQKAIDSATGISVTNVIPRGTDGASQYLEIYGYFPTGTALTLNCGQSYIPLQPTTVHASPTQINFQFPNVNLMTRDCFIGDKISGKNYFDFKLPGLTCNDLASLCPGEVRDIFETVTPDGEQIRIEIRNGHTADAVFDSQAINDIKNFLRYVPPQHLKNLKYIQHAGLSENVEGVYFEQIYYPFGRATDDGGISFYSSRRTIQASNAIANGLASLMYAGMTKEDKTEFGSERNFNLMYSDHYKGESFGVGGLLRDAFLFGDSPWVTATDIRNKLQQALALTSLFYNKETGLWQSFARSYYPSERKSPIIYTSDRLIIDSPQGKFELALNGDEVTSIVRVNSSSFDPPATPIKLPVNTRIPASFLRTVPRT